MSNSIIRFGKASLFALPLLFTAQSSHATNPAMDLMNVWQLAEQQNLQLEIAHANIQLQNEKHQQARAAMLPSVAVNATFSHADNSAIGTENFGQSYSLDLKQGLYHRDVILQAEQVDLLVDDSELGYQQAYQQLQMLVASAYFEQLKAQDSLVQTEQARSAMANRLEEIKARFEVGISNQISVQETQSRVDMMHAQLVANQGLLSNSQHALEEIIHQPAGQLQSLTADANADTLMFIPQQSLQSWQQQAQINSLPLQQLSKQLQLAKLNIRTQEAAKYPGVDLIAQYSRTDNSVSAYGANADQFMLAIKVGMPLYTGGYVESKVNEATLQQQQLQRQLEQSRRSLNTEVHSSYTSVISATQLVRAQQQVLDSARLAFDAMQTAVEIGSRTRVDLLDAERELYSAVNQLNNAKYQLLLAQLKLRFVSGSLSVDDLKKVNAILG